MIQRVTQVQIRIKTDYHDLILVSSQDNYFLLSCSLINIILFRLNLFIFLNSKERFSLDLLKSINQKHFLCLMEQTFRDRNLNKAIKIK